jgi:hypothetical protein
MDYVSPFDPRVARPVHAAPRPDVLAGCTVVLLDIRKARGDEFLDRLATLLHERGAATVRMAKEMFSRPASGEVVAAVPLHGDLAVEALAD